MAVVVDGICVIVRNRTLAQIFPGGVEAYTREVARATYCADDSINRVAFRTKAEAHDHVSRLVSASLSGPSSASPDVVIATGSRGQLRHATGWSWRNDPSRRTASNTLQPSRRCVVHLQRMSSRQITGDPVPSTRSRSRIYRRIMSLSASSGATVLRLKRIDTGRRAS